MYVHLLPTIVLILSPPLSHTMPLTLRLDKWRLTAPEVMHEFEAKDADAVFAFQTRNPTHAGKSLTMLPPRHGLSTYLPTYLVTYLVTYLLTTYCLSYFLPY